MFPYFKNIEAAQTIAFFLSLIKFSYLFSKMLWLMRKLDSEKHSGFLWGTWLLTAELNLELKFLNSFPLRSYSSVVETNTSRESVIILHDKMKKENMITFRLWNSEDLARQVRSEQSFEAGQSLVGEWRTPCQTGPAEQRPGFPRENPGTNPGLNQEQDSRYGGSKGYVPGVGGKKRGKEVEERSWRALSYRMKKWNLSLGNGKF